MQNYLDEQYPNANAVAKKFLLGPGQGGRIQLRFQGPDPAKLRELGDQAIKIWKTMAGGLRAQRLARAGQGNSSRYTGTPSTP